MTSEGTTHRPRVIIACATLIVQTAASACENNESVRTVETLSAQHHTADSLIHHIAMRHESFITMIGNKSPLSPGDWLVPDLQIVDLRESASRAPDNQAIQIGYFEIASGAYHLTIGLRVPGTIVRNVGRSENSVTFVSQHYGRENIRISWRNTANGWKASQIILTRY
jgi:hypothetical protein